MRDIAGRIQSLGLDIGLRDAEELAGRDPGSELEAYSAGLVAMPASTADVVGLVKLCAELDLPIVTHGGRTGLVGGTRSSVGTIVLSTERMDKVERIDVLSGTVVVQAGVKLQVLQEALAEYGLDPGIDFGARGTATIGGMVSTNAGGIQAFRDGVMRHRVLGMEVVLADGRVFDDMKHVVKSNTGFDVKQMFIGAEGTLGVVCRVVLKLSPRPKARATALIAVPNAACGLGIARHLQSLPATSLLACEMMWNNFFRMNVEARKVSVPDSFLGSPTVLLVDIAGQSNEDAAEKLAHALGEVWEECQIEDALIPQSIKKADEIWHVREDMSVFARRYPKYRSYDVSVPPSQIDAYCEQMQQALGSAEPGLEALVFGHIADGNLHVIPQRGNYDEPAIVRIDDAIYSKLEGLGGSIVAEHGIGLKKRDAYERYVSPVKQDLVSKMKQVLDPTCLLNPGKVVRPSN